MMLLVSFGLGHFQVGIFRYRSLLKGLYTLYKSLMEALYYPKLPTCSFL